MYMRASFFILTCFFLIFPLKSVDYFTDQSSNLINQFLLNPESIVSNTEKLLAIAQYISKTLDANQTIENMKQQLHSNKSDSFTKDSTHIGCAKFNANYIVNHKCFIKNKTHINQGNVEGTIQVVKQVDTIQFISKSLKTLTLQSAVIYNQNSGIFIHGDVILGKIKSKTSIKATSFIANGVKQWNLLSHDDFDEHNHQWSYNKTNRCSTFNENYFLGGHCNLASDEVSKTFDNLPPHESIRIQGTFHMFDNWQGEYGYMKINDDIVWKQNGYQPKIKSMNLCGNDDFDDPHMNLKIDKVLSHNATAFKLVFGSSLNKNPCEASFAIDDIILLVK